MMNWKSLDRLILCRAPLAKLCRMFMRAFEVGVGKRESLND